MLPADCRKSTPTTLTQIQPPRPKAGAATFRLTDRSQATQVHGRPVGAGADVVKQGAIDAVPDEPDRPVAEQSVDPARVGGAEPVSFPPAVPRRAVQLVLPRFEPSVPDNVRVPSVGPPGVVVPVAGEVG